MTQLLVAVGILVVLILFAVRDRIGSREKTKLQFARSAVVRNGSIANALTNYKFDMGKYPSTDEGLSLLFLPKDRVADQRYKGPYIDGAYDELMDPWGHTFLYRSPSKFHPDGDGYDLWSCGPDGKNDGGRADSDDVKNWIER